MARYTGPNNKKSRRLKFSILENNKEFIKGKKRITAPGQHGAKRQKLSNYGIHLYEKQKLKYLYGLSEKQLVNTFKKATKMKGVLGINLLIRLESRIDNLVYRMGIASTRRQARQFVNHGHIIVNSKKVDIPSYIAKPGDIISIKERSQKNDLINDNISKKDFRTRDFVEFDREKYTGKYIRLPERDELTQEINEGLVVEYYNK